MAYQLLYSFLHKYDDHHSIFSPSSLIISATVTLTTKKKQGLEYNPHAGCGDSKETI